jgi:hypothetical protein
MRRREFITLLNAPLRHTSQGILFGARLRNVSFRGLSADESVAGPVSPASQPVGAAY